MKKQELLKKLSRFKWELGHGGSHDYVTNGRYKIPIPRHKEISEPLARSILLKVERLSRNP